jgi:hypothetical protein
MTNTINTLVLATVVFVNIGLTKTSAIPTWNAGVAALVFMLWLDTTIRRGK